MNPKIETCYMCERDATTVEHVPPKCLFPEAKDVAGENYRNNIITVPSCVEHNCRKSRDDEFLMVSIAGVLGNNSIGYRHAKSKVDRALKRSAYRLLDKAFLTRKTIRLGDDNKFLDVIIGTPDYQRLISCFSYISFGIFRHHFKSNFQGQCKSILGFLHYKEKNSKSFTAFIKQKALQELENEPRYGNNQRIFFYQFAPPDKFGAFLLRMCFYDGVDVFTSFVPKTATLPTSDLTMALIKAGIKTTITLDGKEHEFN